MARRVFPTPPEALKTSTRRNPPVDCRPVMAALEPITRRGGARAVIGSRHDESTAAARPPGARAARAPARAPPDRGRPRVADLARRVHAPRWAARGRRVLRRRDRRPAARHADLADVGA